MEFAADGDVSAVALPQGTPSQLRFARAARTFSVFLLLAVTGVAQSDISSNPPVPSPATGISSAGANTLGGIESVNTANGNVTLTFPLAQLPPDNVSLGGAGVSLVYNSAVYDAPAIPVSTSQANLEYTASAHGGGWDYGYQYALWAQPRIPLVDMSSAVCGLLSTSEKTYWYKNFLQTPDGTNHILYRVFAIPPAGGPSDDPTGTGFLSTDFAGFGNPNTSSGLNCNISQQQYSGTLVFATVDGSDIRVEATANPGGSASWIAYLPNGTNVSGPILTALDNGSYHAEDSPAGTITDRNGNQVYVYGNCPTGGACQETISDVPGRMINLSFVSSGSNQSSWTDTISWTGPNGGVSAYVNSTLTPMSGIDYQCGSTTSGFDGSYCPLNTSLWHVTSIQMAAPVSNGNQTTFAMAYTPAAGNQNWGELHTLQKCVGVGLTTCSAPQWAVNYNYLFDPASPLRPPGVTINPIASRTLSYTESLDTGTPTPLTETTNYSIWYPPSSVYTLLGGELIGSNTIQNPDGGTTTLSLTSLCATGTVSRDTCAPLIYKAVNPNNSQTELAYGWWTSSPAPPAGIPSGTLVNPYVAISAETRPNGAMRAGQSSPDVNGNITYTYRYDWGTSITRNTNGLVTGVSCSLPCTQLQTSVMGYNEQTTGAVYWNPSADGTQPNLRAVTSLKLNGTNLANYTYDNPQTTANLTQAQLWDSGQNAWITDSRTYDTNGNVATHTDPDNHITATCYDNGSYNLYPQTIIVAASSTTCPNPTEGPVGRESTFQTNFSIGVTLLATDADNHVSTQYTYDNLGRQLTATQSGTGVSSRTATTTYDDAGLEVDTQISSLTTKTDYDPLGRVRLTVDGAGNRIEGAYRYISGNPGYRLQLQSKPYTGSNPPGWTLTTMDTVGRVVEVDQYSGSQPPSPWGSNTTKTGTAAFAYDLTLSGCTGPATSATDEAGNTKYTCSDGLGRLTYVREPDATSGGPGTVTTYGYDNFGNLASVDVSGQPALSCGHLRCFTYSSLSRLLSASNPESGTTSYTYDNNGNLLTRKDANLTTMTVAGYDGLNRPTGASAGAPAISYAVGGQTAMTNSVTYTYDQGTPSLPGFKGALTLVSNTNSTTSYGYDGFGRITASAQTTGTYSPFNFTYGYSPTDALTSIQYPSGRQVNYTLDAGDRVTAVQNVTGGGYYASSIGYTADGGLSGLTLGNTVTETYTWNDRFQAVGMTAGQVGQQPQLQLGLFPCTSNATACGTGNNGNLLSQTIQIPTSPTTYLNLTQTYSYDHLNRLTNAQESGGGANWSQTYSYDTVGNRWIAPGNSTGLPALTNETPTAQSSYSTTVPNRLAGWSYDANGNVLQTGSVARSFTYDGENNQVTACINCTPGPPTATYVYDGLGQRVSKTVSGQTTTYVYDAFGNLAAEYGGTSTSTCTGTCYVTTDHLGSTRLLTNSAGMVAGRYDYEPFGVEIGAPYDGRSTTQGYATTPDASDPKFTGQMRDFETKDANGESFLDFFNARYYAGAQGRFQSPDPGNAGADPSNPQSWNGYAYVGNNPLSFTDPSGMCPSCVLGLLGDAADGSGVGLAIGAAIGLGELFYDIFGGGGPPPSIAPSLATPSSPIMGPTFSVTGWGTADTVAPSWSSVDGTIPVVIPGLLFFAQATGSMPKTKPQPQFTKVSLPPNANICFDNQNYFYAPPTFDINKIEAAGKAGRFSPQAMKAAVGHYGTFDFQRATDSAGNTTFYSGYTPVSNFSVGAYLYSAGFTKLGASTIANTFALFNSSNAGDPAQATYRNLGYDTAARGQVPVCQSR